MTKTFIAKWPVAECKCAECLPSCTGNCECSETVEFEKQFHAK